MYLNRVSLYPEKKICSQMRWESKLLWLPVLLKITYPDLDLPRKTASTVFVLFSLLQAFRQWRVERVIVRGYKKEEGGGGGGDLVPLLTTLPHPLRCGPCKLELHPHIIAITKYLMWHYCTSDAAFFCSTPLDEVAF